MPRSFERAALRKVKRKAWTWIAPTAPPLRSLWAGATGRQRWIKYWIFDTLFDGLQWVGFHVCSVLPVRFVSGIGAIGARQVILWRYPRTVERTLRNLRALRPDWTDEHRRDVALRCFENEGRVLAEFAVLHRLDPEGRVTIEGEAFAHAAAASGPVVVIGLHTGNWEIIGPVGARIGLGAAAVFMPQGSRMQNYLATKVRIRCGIGSSLLPPGKSAVRPALRILEQGGHVLLMCDEAVGPVCVAPLFGGAPHARGNLSVAVRMARHSNAVVLPFYTTRDEAGRYTLRFLPHIRLPESEAPAARLLEDVRILNEAIEPIILDHLDQWYFLSWRNAAVEARSD